MNTALRSKKPHVVVLLLVSAVFASTASQQQDSEFDLADELIHSDLPIFEHGGGNEWPQHFHDEDLFGCTSRVGFGDWVFQKTGEDNENDGQWFRFSNYCAFHCWANASRATTRAGLEHADVYPSFFVFLGSVSVEQRDTELWAIQIGAIPGSEYLLLSRAPADDLIEAFNVLQKSCPRAKYARGWSTSQCRAAGSV